MRNVHGGINFAQNYAQMADRLPPPLSRSAAQNIAVNRKCWRKHTAMNPSTVSIIGCETTPVKTFVHFQLVLTAGDASGCVRRYSDRQAGLCQSRRQVVTANLAKRKGGAD